MRRLHVALAIALIACLAVPLRSAADPGFKPPRLDGPRPWTHARFPDSTRDFRFAIIADNTGGHREGVLEDAVRKLNLLRPDFVLCVGDLIEGYTIAPNVIAEQWDDVWKTLERLEMPFFLTPGNHDLSNDTQVEVWTRRFGPAYYHFVFRDVLFMCVNTEDPPGGHISQAQLDYWEKVLRKNRRVRWTFALMHEPMWTYDDAPEWARFEALLQGRPYTVIAGHYHEYNLEHRFNRQYFTLSTTGGASPLGGPNSGDFDHVAWVAMSDEGPRVANLLLDAIWDDNVYNDTLKDEFGPILSGMPVTSAPLQATGAVFKQASVRLEVTNPTAYPMQFEGFFRSNAALAFAPGALDATYPPGSSTPVEVEVQALRAVAPREMPPLELHWRAVYELPKRPPLEHEGVLYIPVMAERLEPAQFQGLPMKALRGLAVPLDTAGYKAEARQVADFFVARIDSGPALIEYAEVCRAIGYAGDMARRLGFITRWSVVGPFPWDISEGFRGTHVNEPAVDLAAAYPSDGGTVKWRAFDSRDPVGVVDFRQALEPRENATAYAFTRVVAPAPAEAVLRLGSDDGARVWLNGVLVLERDVLRGTQADTDKTPVTLKAGVNDILVQVTQGIEGWSFCLRLTSPEGAPLVLDAP